MKIQGLLTSYEEVFWKTVHKLWWQLFKVEDNSVWSATRLGFWPKQSLYIKETCFHHTTVSFVAVLLLWKSFKIHLWTVMAKSTSIFDMQKMTFVSQPKLMYGYLEVGKMGIKHPGSLLVPLGILKGSHTCLIKYFDQPKFSQARLVLAVAFFLDVAPCECVMWCAFYWLVAWF